MFSTFNLFTLRGIPIRVHGTLLVLLLVLGIAWNVGTGLSGFLLTVLMLASIVGFVLLHELGHSLVALHYGIRVRDITLYPLGGIASLDRMPRKPSTEFQIAIAGPLVNLALAAVFALVRAVFPLALLDPLVHVNLALALFNLLPAFPLDGGRILRAFLATRRSYAEATRIAAKTGQNIAIALGLLGLLTFHVMLILIAVFVYFAAQAELVAVLAGEPRFARPFPHGPRAAWFGSDDAGQPGFNRPPPPRRSENRAADRVVIEVMPDGTVRRLRS